MTPKQFAYVRGKLQALEQEIMTMSTGPERMARDGNVVRFHTTIYLSPLSTPPAEAAAPTPKRRPKGR